ncbi:MAG: hypothetical protein M3245_03825 [Actinomycetota bacterium]|nr:hypothetical protein [Actinomycetota bacterium]
MGHRVVRPAGQTASREADGCDHAEDGDADYRDTEAAYESLLNSGIVLEGTPRGTSPLDLNNRDGMPSVEALPLAPEVGQHSAGVCLEAL